MSFDSLGFLFFAATALLARYAEKLSWPTRKASLLALSMLFYASWSPYYVPFLLFSMLVDWSVARRLDSTQNPLLRRLWLMVSIVCNLGLLGYFKYAAFVSSVLSELGGSVVVRESWGSPSAFIPLGISFFTFQTLSYTIDVYRGHMRSDHRWVDYALFVTFFPQLVSGPIIRASEFIPQLEAAPTRKPISGGYAACLVCVGIFQKVVIADHILGPIADQVYMPETTFGPLATTLGVLSFFGQMYADFAGYSNVAIGLALAMGFRFRANFWCPQVAASVQEFWRRWHISLGEWLRDYLYIPLGGRSRSFAVWARNITLVMLASGFWHGASLKFASFGIAHAIAMILGQLAPVRRALAHLGTWPRIAFTYLFVAITTIPFRALDLHHAGSVLYRCIAATTVATHHLSRTDTLLTAITIATMLAGQAVLKDRDFQGFVESMHWPIRSLVLTGMILAIIFAGGSGRDFVYFAF